MNETSPIPGWKIPPFLRLLGLEYVSAEKSRVVARITVREDHGNGRETMHGGAIMSIGDTLGAVGTILNLPPNTTTTTLESKTNFIAPAPIGCTLTGEATPMHIGRTTQIWTTRITRDDGKLVAVTTQTQIVLPKT